MRRGLAVLSVAGSAFFQAGLSSAAPARDLLRIDVCAWMPGADVARVAQGALVEARRFNAPDGTLARCVYLVGPPGGKETSAWVVELHSPGTFDEVRPFVEAPVKEVAGLGDGAWEYKDPDSGRWRLYTRKRGDATISVTGAQEPVVREVAALVLSRP